MPQRLPADTPEHLAQALSEAAARLHVGELVAFPTETVYGLGANARDANAVAKVYAAKGRPRSHPLIVHLARAADMRDWAQAIPDAAWHLAEHLWPGPLTLVLQRAASVPLAVTGGQDTVALRVPAHPVARALIEAFGGGIAAPSANRFGRISPTTAEHVLADFADNPQLLVIDGGPCGVGIESTIVDMSGGAPRVLRPGGVDVATIAALLGVEANDLLQSGTVRADTPRVPGALARHYAPSKPTRLVDEGAGSSAPGNVAVLARRPFNPREVRAGVKAEHWFELPNDPTLAARALYPLLRALEASAADSIWLERVPSALTWLAVADRLQRAAAGAHEEAS